MADLATDPLAAGGAALAAGDWIAARASFEAALLDDDSPVAHDGLARALWWVDGPARAIAERIRAYAGYRQAADQRAAAHVALWIAHEYEAGLGNSAAAGGWLTRAAGLLEQLPEDGDHARLELVRGERAGNPLDAGRHAKAALEIARRLGSEIWRSPHWGGSAWPRFVLARSSQECRASTRRWRPRSEGMRPSSRRWASSAAT